MANLSCYETKEREVSVVEEKSPHETTSIQGQGCSEEGDKGRNSCTPETESPSGKFLEKIPYVTKLEYDGEKDGSHPMIKISVNTDISVIGFYGNIGNIGKYRLK